MGGDDGSWNQEPPNGFMDVIECSYNEHSIPPHGRHFVSSNGIMGLLTDVDVSLITAGPNHRYLGSVFFCVL